MKTSRKIRKRPPPKLLCTKRDEARAKYNELIPNEYWPLGRYTKSQEEVDKLKESYRKQCLGTWDKYLNKTRG